MFYTIFKNCILKAKNKEILEKFYNSATELPQDYEENKYIVQNNKLVLNPNWEDELKKIEIEKNNNEIKEELNKLDLKSIRALRAGDSEYLKEYEARAVELRAKLL